ncbi:MAG: phosphoribosylformylglycinamidine synthase, partial [Desulfobacula sp.]|nr:phosphoribosylformylglycinamidine synthase [Desulfobacula sp.]
SLLPWYSKIDAYHMMACTIDEAVRRVMAVGGNFDHIGGLDNFCWPNIQFDPKKNPDGTFKAAQLVRACRALKETSEKYEIPLLSGKDSMYVDGHLVGEFGERVKVSALETVQFSATSVIDDISKCVTMDPKVSGDLVYVLGVTTNELGASEYYEAFDKTGLNVPHVDFDKFKVVYKAVQTAIENELVASCHAVARGGLGAHLSYMTMAGGLGLEVNLSDLPMDASRGELSNETVLFSESAGRFIVTVSPENKNFFEKLFKGMAASCVGFVTDLHDRLKISALNKETLIDLSMEELEKAFNKTFGDMI